MADIHPESSATRKLPAFYETGLLALVEPELIIGFRLPVEPFPDLIAIYAEDPGLMRRDDERIGDRRHVGVMMSDPVPGAISPPRREVLALLTKSCHQNRG